MMRFILKQVRHIGWFWNAFVFWFRHLDWHVRKAGGLRLNAPLYCDGTGQVSLGSDIAIGYGLFAILGDGMVRLKARGGAARIQLGDGTAISNNTQVFAELRITVGAGSVVVRSIPPGVIAAGNPAKVIRPL
jgi:maltose O-acetyltransferase